MAGPNSRERFSGALGGLFFVVLGVALLLDRWDFLDFSRYWDYWPVALVVVGVVAIAGDPGSWFGFASLLVGGFLLARTLGALSFEFWELWPVALVASGLSTLARQWFPVRPNSGRSCRAESCATGG